MELNDVTRTAEWEALRAATETLYTVFASYPLRDVIEGCSHCVDEADNARIHSKPLRELTDADLDTFLLNNASDTWGNEFDLKHFLPRLFELVTFHLAGQPCLLDPELIGEATRRRGYSAWPETERQAIVSFSQSWWRTLLAAFPCGPLTSREDAETVLCTIAQYSDDLAPYLTTWYRTRTLAALGHLVEFVVSDCIPDGPYDGWWSSDGRSWLLKQLLHWVREPGTLAYVIGLAGNIEAVDPAACARYVDEQFAQRLNQTLAWLAARVAQPT